MQHYNVTPVLTLWKNDVNTICCFFFIALWCVFSQFW